MTRLRRLLTRLVLDSWLRHWWGERCHDFCPECPRCEAWRARDLILAEK